MYFWENYRGGNFLVGRGKKESLRKRGGQNFERGQEMS